MTTVRRLSALALAVAFACPPVQAQPPTPKPGPEHEIFKKLVGTWETTMDVGGMKSKGVATYKMDIGGLWLASTFEGDMGGEKFSGRGFDTYDAGKKKYIGVWLDSMSTTPMVSEGTFDKSTHTMTMVGEGPGMDGKPTKYRSVSQMTDDNTMKFAMYMGDMKEPAFTILYQRKK